jgi:hypothetical protein
MHQIIGIQQWLFYLSIPIYTLCIWFIGFAAGWMMKREGGDEPDGFVVRNWPEREYTPLRGRPSAGWCREPSRHWSESSDEEGGFARPPHRPNQMRPRVPSGAPVLGVGRSASIRREGRGV